MIRNDSNYNFDIDEIEAMSINELLDNTTPAKRRELHWRISQPLMIVVLTIMAFALSYSKPRASKFSKIAPSFAIFLIYLGLIIYQTDLIKKK